jgi:hypothetical protein
VKAGERDEVVKTARIEAANATQMTAGIGAVDSDFLVSIIRE